MAHSQGILPSVHWLTARVHWLTARGSLAHSQGILPSVHLTHRHTAIGYQNPSSSRYKTVAGGWVDFDLRVCDNSLRDVATYC